MSIDLETAGAAATAALAARELEAGGQSQGQAAPSPVCANCAAALAGAYCHQCGQNAHLHRSLWHMFEESLHGVLHFDTKSWRTLPLLMVRPGALTRRYINGQRVRSRADALQDQEHGLQVSRSCSSRSRCRFCG